MARVKVTSSDIYARLARGECANYRQNACQGRTPCTIVNGEPCQYFDVYVKPLLDYTEFENRYAREAKQTLALNPKAKVVRKRRQAAETGALLLESEAKAVKPPTRPAKTGRAANATAPSVKKSKPGKSLPLLAAEKAPARTDKVVKPSPKVNAPAPIPAAKIPVKTASPAAPPKVVPAAKVVSTTPATPRGSKAPVAPTPLPTPTRIPAEAPAKTRVKHEDIPITTLVTVSGDVLTKPVKAAKKRTPAPPSLPSLSLFDFAPAPAKPAAGKKHR